MEPIKDSFPSVFIMPLMLIILAIFIIIYFASRWSGFTIEPPHRTAGRRGERAATEYIKSVLYEDDILLTNISVSFEGKPAELDNVVINKYGVFIIEVKYYSGKLYGLEDDFEWEKVHISDGGNEYVKVVKNPIKQVRRETYILANYLRYFGVRVWVEGYVIILGGARSPVISDCILSSTDDIDKAIHTQGKQKLSDDTMNSIMNLLQ